MWLTSAECDFLWLCYYFVHHSVIILMRSIWALRVIGINPVVACQITWGSTTWVRKWFGYISLSEFFLVYTLVHVGLVYQYHSQALGWKTPPRKETSSKSRYLHKDLVENWKLCIVKYFSFLQFSCMSCYFHVYLNLSHNCCELYTFLWSNHSRKLGRSKTETGTCSSGSGSTSSNCTVLNCWFCFCALMLNNRL